MTGQTPLRRRTVVRTIGAIAGGTIAVSTVAASTDSEADTGTDAAVDAGTDAAADAGTDAAADAGTDAAVDTDRPTQPTTHAGTDSDASQYVAVVDRIVDDRFVVLLLEDDGELVDQHVEPASEMDDVEETDILQVVLKDGSVLAYTQLDERPGAPADEESE